MTPPDTRARLEALRGGADPQDVLALFDDLPPVALEEMIGAWRGTEVPTGHRLGGLLASFGWHGKRFDSIDDAHPLVFRDARGELRDVDPSWVPIGMAVRYAPLLRRTPIGPVARWFTPLVTTVRPRARLRTTHYRGVASATMIYDSLPINDVFRRVDVDLLLGAMDLRDLSEPLFFVLEREAGPLAGPGKVRP